LGLDLRASGGACIGWQGSQDILDKLPTNVDDAPMARKSKPLSVTDQIRRHVRECGLSAYAIGKATGIDKATLSKFLAGERGISAKALDRLGELLEFEIVRHGPKT